MRSLAATPEVIVARLAVVTLVRIAPPYHAFAPWRWNEVRTTPFGAVVHAVGPSGLAVIGAVANALRHCPWTVPVVTLPPHEEGFAPVVELFTDLHYRLAFAAASRHAQTVGDVIGAAVRRSLPTPDTLATFVASRVGQTELFEPLIEQFDTAINACTSRCRSVATYSRLFARYGALTARHWRSLAILAHDNCARQQERSRVGNGVGPYRGAGNGHCGLERTVDRYARQFLGLSFAATRARLGWEWVFECALRRAGYLRDKVDCRERKS